MKKSELSFKVLTITKQRTIQILDALNKANIEIDKEATDATAIEIANGVFSYWTQPFDIDCQSFDESPFSETSLSEAIKLIESIEPDAPEFDIKPFDKVICRCEENARWNCDFFNFMERNIIYVVGFHIGTGMQVIKADGNKHLIGTTDTPAGWWECENGKPVWRTK